MKDIKLSFPFPATSRHNLSQDVGMSLSMGLVTPVRVVEVLPGDSHRIGTSFSLISNPLVKPLLQGVNLRYCRFWVPRRIYHLDQRANNSNFDPQTVKVRVGQMQGLYIPFEKNGVNDYVQLSNFQASSLFDYLGLADVESNFFLDGIPSNVNVFGAIPVDNSEGAGLNVSLFNAEPYLAYVDICRNYFADSASGSIAWSVGMNDDTEQRRVLVSPLAALDDYIDGIQNSSGVVKPYDWGVQPTDINNSFYPFLLGTGIQGSYNRPIGGFFTLDTYGLSHVGLCVPMNRPDRLSRSFDTRPLTSQNATVRPTEISISNLSFLAKFQRYITRRFFGGSRFTDVMYSVYGQRVPHVDSPVCLDVFDFQVGSELVASTNATEQQNPGVLGGFFSVSGNLTSSRGRHKKRYTFNESGYLIDVVYIMPRIFRTSFYSDFYSVYSDSAALDAPMTQGNFIPDFNGIGWQQPAYVNSYLKASFPTDGSTTQPDPVLPLHLAGFTCEPSWQQYRTLPDVCRGLLNPNRGLGVDVDERLSPLFPSPELNSPLFIFSDRAPGYNVLYRDGSVSFTNDELTLHSYFRMLYSDFNLFNRIFGVDRLTYDNMFCVFRFAHEAKRQVTKRFTLSFN